MMRALLIDKWTGRGSPLRLLAEPEWSLRSDVGFDTATLICEPTAAQAAYLERSQVMLVDVVGTVWFGDVVSKPDAAGRVVCEGENAVLVNSRREALYLDEGMDAWYERPYSGRDHRIDVSTDDFGLKWIWCNDYTYPINHVNGAMRKVPRTDWLHIEFTARRYNSTDYDLQLYTGVRNTAAEDGYSWTLRWSWEAVSGGTTSITASLDISGNAMEAILFQGKNIVQVSPINDTPMTVQGLKVYGVAGVERATPKNVLDHVIATDGRYSSTTHIGTYREPLELRHYETFTGADGDPLPAGWATPIGTAQIYDNTWRGMSTPTVSTCTAAGSLTDFKVTCHIDNIRQGIVFGYVSANDYWRIVYSWTPYWGFYVAHMDSGSPVYVYEPTSDMMLAPPHTLTAIVTEGVLDIYYDTELYSGEQVHLGPIPLPGYAGGTTGVTCTSIGVLGIDDFAVWSYEEPELNALFGPRSNGDEKLARVRESVPDWAQGWYAVDDLPRFHFQARDIEPRWRLKLADALTHDIREGDVREMASAIRVHYRDVGGSERYVDVFAADVPALASSYLVQVGDTVWAEDLTAAVKTEAEAAAIGQRALMALARRKVQGSGVWPVLETAAGARVPATLARPDQMVRLDMGDRYADCIIVAVNGVGSSVTLSLDTPSPALKTLMR